MTFGCPECSNVAKELLVCDSCSSLGCVRCIVKANKQWVCNKCKSGTTVQASSQGDMFSMFG